MPVTLFKAYWDFLTVTAAHLKQSTPCNAENCALAEALREKYHASGVRIHPQDVSWFEFVAYNESPSFNFSKQSSLDAPFAIKRRIELELEPIARVWTRAYDAEIEMVPNCFAIWFWKEDKAKIYHRTDLVKGMFPTVLTELDKQRRLL